MLQPDVTHLLTDPSLGGNTPFTILRTTFTLSQGTLTESTTHIPATGLIQPAPPSTLTPTEVEDTPSESIRLWTTTPLTLGSDSSHTLPDRIEYKEKAWRIVKLHDWQAYGYFEAVLVLNKVNG